MKYIEDRDKRQSLADTKEGSISLFVRKDGTFGAVDTQGQYLGVDKRLQARFKELEALPEGERQAHLSELRQSIDLAYLCQVDDSGQPARVMKADGSFVDASFGWCLVEHTVPGVFFGKL